MLLDPVVLGELIRHLQEWQSLHEAEGTDSLTGPDGSIYCLADMLHLYELSRRLDPLEALAIRCLYEDRPDAEAARLMATDGSRQVSDYALDGLRRLCAEIRGMPSPGGLRERADPGVPGRRDLALCQV